MPKHTNDLHAHHLLSDGAEASEGLGLGYLNPGPNPGPDLEEPEPAIAADPLAQRFFTLFTAGKIFGKSPRTMRWWADTGRIRSVKIGASRFITAAEIERLQRGGEG
jgi:hypothetical protein